MSVIPYTNSNSHAASYSPTCTIDSYAGGFLCCRDGHSLLDSDQEIPWQDQYLEYHLKFRFYFEEYIASTSTEVVANFSNTADETDNFIKPSHENLLNFVWMTESNAQEYDTPLCPKGTHSSQCLHMITSRFQARDMVRDCPIHPDATICSGVNASQSRGIKLIYASAHCHAGSCHSMELYNMDTGTLICRVLPVVGHSDDEVFNERGYIALPPCLFSDNTTSGEGLLSPEVLAMNTTLMSIKRVNTTFGHTGEMAMWQMRGVLVPKDITNVPITPEDFAEPDLEPQGTDTNDDARSIVSVKVSTFLYLALFVACAVVFFFLSMYVWSIAFRPRTPQTPVLYRFQDEQYDLFIAEERGLV